MTSKNYSRVFAFGCSMTRYSWPTWADIYGSDFPEYYNYGSSGAGNVFISNQIVEQSLRHNIGEGDKVLIMWSSETRIDSYDNGWRTPGNIYTQDEYPKEVENLFSPRGFLIRDLAIVKMTEKFLQSLGCEYFVGVMQKFTKEDDNNLNTEIDKDIFELYDIENFSYPSLLESVGGKWPQINCTNWGNSADMHPDPIMHYEFLEFAGLNPTESMRKYMENWQQKVDKYKTHQEVGWDDDIQGSEMDRL